MLSIGRIRRQVETLLRSQVRLLEGLLAIPRLLIIIINLAVNGNLDTIWRGGRHTNNMVAIGIRVAQRINLPIRRIVIVHTALPIARHAPLARNLRAARRAQLIQGVRLSIPNAHLVGAGAAAPANDVRRRARARATAAVAHAAVARRGGERKGAAADEAPAHGENDAQGHGRGEHGGHAGHDRADGVGGVVRLDEEPEEDVGEVREDDGAVEVEAITEHQLPEGERAHGQGRK